jgi:ubiquinone/menaquinone biosynthesis C-methylase UbiE
VLELGCGTGYFTKEIAKTGASVVAIDISPDMIRLALSYLNELENVECVIGNAYDLVFPDRSFDYVIGSSVLHHLDIAKALKEIHRVLKPDGKIRFTEPNMLNPQIALQKNIPYIKRKLGDSPDETAFFKCQIKRLLIRNDFHQIQITPFDFLHPAIPASMISFVKGVEHFLERTPLIKGISGSLFITALR